MRLKTSPAIDKWKDSKMEESAGCTGLRDYFYKYFPACGECKFVIEESDAAAARYHYKKISKPRSVVVKLADDSAAGKLYDKAYERFKEIAPAADAAYEYRNAPGRFCWKSEEDKALYEECAALVGILPAVEAASQNPGCYIQVSWDSDVLGFLPKSRIKDLKAVKDRVLLKA